MGANGSIQASETLLQITFILVAFFMLVVPLDAFRLRAAARGLRERGLSRPEEMLSTSAFQSFQCA